MLPLIRQLRKGTSWLCTTLLVALAAHGWLHLSDEQPSAGQGVHLQDITAAHAVFHAFDCPICHSPAGGLALLPDVAFRLVSISVPVPIPDTAPRLTTAALRILPPARAPPALTA